SATTSTTIPGSGKPIDPGFDRPSSGEEVAAGAVSVIPQPLVSGRPSTRWQRSATATGSGAPPQAQHRCREYSLQEWHTGGARPAGRSHRHQLWHAVESPATHSRREGSRPCGTSEARSPDLPDVPTMAQSGFPQLTRGDWIGFWAPAGTSPDIVNRLNR